MRRWTAPLRTTSLPADAVRAILYGADVPINVRTRGGMWQTTYEGVIPQLMRRYKEAASDSARAEIEQYMRIGAEEDRRAQ